MTVKSKTKIVCVSHEEDADGISSAALIKQAFGGDTIYDIYTTILKKQRDENKITPKTKYSDFLV